MRSAIQPGLPKLSGVRARVPSLCMCLSLAAFLEAQGFEGGAKASKAVVVVAVAIGEIDRLNSQETLFNQNEPAGWGLCSGKW